MSLDWIPWKHEKESFGDGSYLLLSGKVLSGAMSSCTWCPATDHTPPKEFDSAQAVR